MSKQPNLPAEVAARFVELLKPLAVEPEYPEADDEPMAESDVHRDQMTDALLHPLKERFAGRADVYVSANLNVYCEEGNPAAVVAPDVFVVFGVSNRARRTYKVWQEKKAPDVVFELTSASTRGRDLGDKRLLYERLGVQEYFLFDPLGEYLEPPLQGFRLSGGYYAPLVTGPRGEGEWQLDSAVLGLELHTEGHSLRLYDPAAGHYLLTPPEQAQARRAAEQRAAEAEARAAELEAEIAHLKAALEGQTGERSD